VSAIAEGKNILSKDSRKPLSHRNLVFRCMVYPRLQVARLDFVAECIDLDIIVIGSTQRAAQESLHEAVRGYLRVAAQGDTKGLIPRPSPWNHRLKYHLFALRAALSNGTRTFLVSDFAADPC